MKSFLTWIMIFSFVGTSFGAGFPTMDAVVAKQLLVNYGELQRQLTELKLAVKISEDHYLQVLKEYADYVQQIERLYETATDEEWLMFLTLWDEYYGDGQSSVIPSMDKTSPTYEKDLNVVLGQFGEVPRQVNEIETDAKALGIWSTEYEKSAQEDYDNYNRHKDRMRMVSQNETESQERRKEIQAHARVVGVLKDTNSSDLRTLQEIATQNVTIMEQLETIIEQQNQRLLNEGWDEAQKHSAQAKSREYEINRLKNKPVRTSQYGADRIGDF